MYQYRFNHTDKPSEPEPNPEPTSSSSEKEDGHVDARSECLGTLEDVQELMQEYQSLPDSEKVYSNFLVILV